MDIVGCISGSISLLEKAKALADKTKILELKETILELQGQLIDLKSQAVKLLEENAKLKEAVAKPSQVVINDGVYYSRDGEGPFCTKCFDSKSVLSRLTELGTSHRVMGKWKCPVCRAYLGVQ
jgi:hypothetical protein